MQNPILLVDTWQYGGLIDEAVLFASGVSGMLVRLNSIDGGTRKDANFDAQWAQAANLPVRIPYFVYNPWISGLENYAWLRLNLPSDVKGIVVDVEIRKDGLSPTLYAGELKIFLGEVSKSFNVMIYTGEGYLDLLSTWPIGANYWWAEYPVPLYPANSVRMSWDNLRTKLLAYDAPLNLNKVPGHLSMWQCSGDRLIMDGCEKPIDVNVWMGSMADLLDFAGESSIIPVPPSTSLEFTRSYYDGMVYKKYHKQTPHGVTNYHIMEIETAKAEFFVSPQLASRKYVPDFLDAFQLDLAINGDGFVSITIAGYAASEGNPYGKLGVEEPIYIGKENVFSFARPSPVWNAISHPNRLVIDGQVVPINKSIDDIRARTAWGYNKDQSKVFFFVCDGGDYYSTQGFNFQEVAQIMLDLGCWIAVMQDGGGSTTMSVRDNGVPKIIGVTSGEDQVIKYPGYNLRRVANVLAVRMKTNSNPPPVIDPPIGGTMSTYKVIKSARFRSLPTMTTNDTGASSIVGDVFDSAVSQPDTNNPAITMVQHPNGKWLPLFIDTTTYTEKQVSTPPPTPSTSPIVAVWVIHEDGTKEEFERKA